MTIEQIANLGNWRRAGDISLCDVAHCLKTPTKSAEIVTKDHLETWYFCKVHFAEYLRLTDELREKARIAAAGAA